MNDKIFVFQVKNRFLKLIFFNFRKTNLQDATYWKYREDILPWKKIVLKKFPEAKIRVCKIQKVLL